MKFIALIAVTFFTPLALFAQAEPDYQALFKNLQKLQQDLKQSEKSAVACEASQVKSCKYGDYCQSLRNQSQNFYLYKNSEGKTVPNSFFIRLVDQVRACLDQPLPEVDTQDVFANPLKLKKSDPRYKSELARTQKVFADAQARVVNLLESRKNAGNSKEIDQEIKRIKAIKMISPVFTDKRELERECGYPGASYDSTTNTVVVCPQMLGMPDASIFSVFSHEIGHAVDPCNAYSEIAGDSVAVGKNPFTEVISCLSKPDSMGAKNYSKQQIKDAITKEEKDYAKSLGPLSAEVKAEYDKRRKVVDQNFDKYRYCRNFSRNADMQEGFADWVSAKVLAQKVAEIKDPAAAKTYAFEAQLTSAASECESVKVAAINRIEAALKNDCPQFADYKEQLLHPDDYADTTKVPHPKISRRVDKILFAQPEMQKALGCTPSGSTSVCD
ncbi:hypothetical protein DOM22_16385 [Bdellovibrio sp. ZAP7]|uniref:hypothetical protein n=1 Tax=Bdellovibrio sp. ZAP7 TaxID=2231053 RepID=UPI00115A94E9|nr:hypothetical protein [Bdellovibrio sp. ZAP7]QDK46619.1 hypothetical protein DOM22_16385 [Bdellovibrio sp. ZAP7]